MQSDKHLFTLYVADLTNIVAKLKTNSILTLPNKTIWQRIVKVLRLKQNEKLILFDTTINLEVILNQETFTNKKSLFCTVFKIVQNKHINPEITLLTCLTKKTVFEEIVYTSAMLGVKKIIPILSEKVLRNWFNDKETHRLNKIMITACEQAKNFIIPQILPPKKLTSIIPKLNSQQTFKVFFDKDGSSFSSFFGKQNFHDIKNLTILFGPEGGLTIKENNILKNNGFMSYSLTPTVLRAKDAICIGIGSIRSLM